MVIRAQAAWPCVGEVAEHSLPFASGQLVVFNFVLFSFAVTVTYSAGLPALCMQQQHAGLQPYAQFTFSLAGTARSPRLPTTHFGRSSFALGQALTLSPVGRVS